MTCLELYRQHFPELAASLTEERETFKGKCPACAHSTDRLALWKNSDRFFCRNQNDCDRAGGICEGTGTSIGFLMTFLGMSKQEAVQTVKGEASSFRKASSGSAGERGPQVTTRKGKEVAIDREQWSKTAEKYMRIWQGNLTCSTAQEKLKERAITIETARKACMGYVAETRYDYDKRLWGIAEDGRTVIPSGLVMGARSGEGTLVALEVRCYPDLIFYRGTEREKPVGHLDIAGSATVPYVYHGNSGVVAMFESILDAILAWQSSGYRMTCLATGGAEKPLTPDTIAFVKSHAVRISCADYDIAGIGAYAKWNQAVNFTHIVPFYGKKDLGDMQKAHDEGEPYPSAEAWFMHDILPLLPDKERESAQVSHGEDSSFPQGESQQSLPELPESMKAAMDDFSRYIVKDRDGIIEDNDFWYFYIAFAKKWKEKGYFIGEDDRAHEYISEKVGAKRIRNPKTMGFDLIGVKFK